MAGDSGGFGAPPPPPPPPSAGGGGPLPPRGLGDILTAAFDVYKANAARLIGIVAIVVVPLALLEAISAKVVFAANCNDVPNAITGTSIRVCDSRAFFTILAGSVIGIAIGFVMTFVVQAAIARAAGEATVGDPVDAGESYRWGFRHLGSVLLISLLAGLIILGGLLLLVIPGIIFAIFLAVVIPAFLFENKRGTEAVSRSWKLVSGNFWHTLATVLVAGIITGVITGIFGALGGSNWFLSWIMNSIGRIITIPFTALVTVILYLDLRARSESLTGDQVRAELATNR
jgi:hypothetical protein